MEVPYNGYNIIFQNGIYNNLQITINNTINLITNGNVIFKGNDIGTAIKIKSNNTNISGLNIQNYSTSIYSVNTKNNQIKTNNIENIKTGIKLVNSNNTKITNNVINGKNSTGIFLVNSQII